MSECAAWELFENVPDVLAGAPILRLSPTEFSQDP